MIKKQRISYSTGTLDLLKAFAEQEGHNNLSAALATVVKYGVPLLQAQRYGTVQIAFQPNPAYVPASQVEQQNQDDVINRLAGLLEDF